MKQSSVDAQLMAIESLAHIANVCDCQGYAAETILGHSEILPFLLSFVRKCDTDSSRSVENELDSSSECKLHRAAMTVVANCLHSLQTNGKLQQCMGKHRDTLLCEKLLASLLGEVSHCEQKPHEACQAIRCLEALCKASSETKQHMKDADILVERAHEASMHRHALLGDLSKQFLKTWEH